METQDMMTKFWVEWSHVLFLKLEISKITMEELLKTKLVDKPTMVSGWQVVTR